jgi:hypothetical protein
VTQERIELADGERTIKSRGTRRVYVRRDNGECSIAENGVWLPGIYADEAAAWAAFEFDDATLARVTHYEARGVGSNYQPMTLQELHAVAAKAAAGEEVGYG